MSEPAPPSAPDGALSPELRAVLRRWADEGGPLATRAGVVLLAADGLRDAEISRRLGVSRQTVGSWRQRWTSAGIDGLEHRPRTGRPATVDEAEVVTRTLLAPGGSGASRAVARELGLSHATVAGIRRRWRLVPDEPVAPSVPTRPPLPDADVWVMGLYVDAHRAVLLAGTRLVPSTPATAGTVIGADVLASLDHALDTARRASGPESATAVDNAHRAGAAAHRAANHGPGNDAGPGPDPSSHTTPAGHDNAKHATAGGDRGVPPHSTGVNTTPAGHGPARHTATGHAAAGGDRSVPAHSTAEHDPAQHTPTGHTTKTAATTEGRPTPGTGTEATARRPAQTGPSHTTHAATDAARGVPPHSTGVYATPTGHGPARHTATGHATAGGDRSVPAHSTAEHDPAQHTPTGHTTKTAATTEGHPAPGTGTEATARRPAQTGPSHTTHTATDAARGVPPHSTDVDATSSAHGPARHTATGHTTHLTAEGDHALSAYLAQASRRHPDLALHAITLWDDAPADAAPQPPDPTRPVTSHHIPARSTWRTFLRAMIALDSTSHPESSRRVYLDLAAELERYTAGRADDPYRTVRWLRENVAGHLGTEDATDNSVRGHTWSGVNQIDLGSFNECVVIETVRLSGTITRGEIAHRTGLTQQSVSRIARSLLDRGILIEDAQLRATSGKPRTPVRLRGAAAHALGIHIDPELLTAVVIDLDGAIVCTRTRSVSADTDPAEFVERVAALGRETLAEAGGAVRPEGFLGIGVAVPGPVDIASGTVLGPPLMSAWGDLPLLYLLKDHFPCPVIMEKDSTAAAAGERWIGRDRRARDFAYLYLGTGVGTGLYLNGDIYRGVSSNAGEFGQLCAIALGRVDEDGRPEILPECNPPVSVPDLAARGGLRPAATTSGSTAAYLAVGRAAAAGDRAAKAAVREVAQAVGRGALGLIDLLDIDLIVLGGPFFTDDVADFYLSEIARTVNEYPTARRLRRVEVEPSVLSAGAAAVGAASTIFHATFTPRLRGRETRARHLPAG
ncbi:ROK family protein [Streptomyces niveus]|uniref:ROK family protein n=1 Tax=Streptomyces niveus TaxID=193462 RepID=UPI00363C9570